MNTSDIKTKLFNHCLEYVNFHIETTSTAIEQAQDASRSETKTVASEEPETGKERSQIEIETLRRRLDEIFTEMELLQSLPYTKTLSCIEPGALTTTSMGAFFIALSADEIIIDGVEYCPVSLESPIGQAIKGKKAGESASFRGKTIRIELVC